MSRRFTTHSCAVLLLLVTAGRSASAQDGGIELFAGEGLFFQGFRVSVAHLHLSRTKLYDGDDRVHDPQDRWLKEQRLVLGTSYGVTARLTLTGLLPLVERRFRDTLPTGRISETLRGLGDASILAKYRFYTLQRTRSAVNAAVVGGLELPTGETDARLALGSRVDPERQLGSGSLDPFLGLGLTWSPDLWRFDSQVLYKWNTEGRQSFDAADLFTVGVSASYRFVHERYPGPSHSARLGLLWRHEGRAQSHGSLVHDSGANQLILRPGFTFHPRPSMDIVLNFDYPILQRYNGQQLGLDARTFVALGFRF